MEFLSRLQLYFRGEKTESAVLLVVSLGLLAGAILLAFWVRQPFTRGLGAVLLLAGLIGVTVAGTVFFRTDAQVAQLRALHESSRADFAQIEARRMDKVVASFRFYRFMYILAGVAGVLLVSLTARPALHGAAVGLFLFAAMGFTIDHYAEERARWYAAEVHAQGAPD